MSEENQACPLTDARLDLHVPAGKPGYAARQSLHSAMECTSQWRNAVQRVGPWPCGDVLALPPPLHAQAKERQEREEAGFTCEHGVYKCRICHPVTKHNTSHRARVSSAATKHAQTNREQAQVSGQLVARTRFCCCAADWVLVGFQGVDPRVPEQTRAGQSLFTLAAVVARQLWG
eukprot:356451-Chlamydomonas_euryale.AAC.5